MGKLLNLANLGVDIYQSKQLAALNASQNELRLAHTIEGMTSEMEVEKRKLILQFESEFEKIDFDSRPKDSARSLCRIRKATNSLDLTPSGFREFADMERAKAFNDLLSRWEEWASNNVGSEVMSNAKLANKYLFEDDDLEEYAGLQYVKERLDHNTSATGKVLGGLFLAAMVGMLVAVLIGMAVGDPYAENFFAEESDSDGEPTDLFTTMFCGLSLVAIVPFFRWFKVDLNMVKLAFSTSELPEVSKILEKGGGQELLDEYVSVFGEMSSDEIIEERLRRLTFVTDNTDSSSDPFWSDN